MEADFTQSRLRILQLEALLKARDKDFDKQGRQLEGLKAEAHEVGGCRVGRAGRANQQGADEEACLPDGPCGCCGMVWQLPLSLQACRPCPDGPPGNDLRQHCRAGGRVLHGP